MSEYVTPKIPRKDKFPHVDESALANPVENPHDQRFKIIGTCEHCRFWKEHPKAKGVGECPEFPSIDGSPIKGTDDFAGIETDAMYYTGHEYYGGEYFGKDFGCIQWEVKE